MGEAKRKSESRTPHEIMLEGLARRLTDQGKLIEAGWVGLQKTWLRSDSPPEQVKELRMAFMAGAQHLFASIMTILEPGSEPTDADMARMGLIAAELEIFGRELVADLPTAGRA